jgi:uncharacterized protein (DUF1697 family)
MTHYVAFLRGINVGGRIVKMADLQSCLHQLGLENIKTYLQSGNVSFESPEKSTDVLKKQIEKSLTDTFGYPAKVQVFSHDKLAAIVAANPFKDADATKHQYVIFMENGLESELCNEAKELDDNQEMVECGQGVVYWKVHKGNTLKSSFAKQLTKAKYKDFNTNRNVNTLQKML